MNKEILKNRVYLLQENKLFKLKELYFCIHCSKIRNDFQVRKEIEYYYCNGCTQSYTKNETVLYSYQCLRCFKCPCCFSCLIIAHKILDSDNRSMNPFKTESHIRSGGSFIFEDKSNSSYVPTSFSLELENQRSKISWEDNEKESDEFVKNFISIASNMRSNKMKGSSLDDVEDIIESELGRMKSGTEFLRNEESESVNKVGSLSKKKKKLFYFKCQYCIWSSLYTIYNTKLDELIGDMIILERNCPSRLHLKNILEEIKKQSMLQKKGKVIKSPLITASHLVPASGSFNSLQHLNHFKQNHITDIKKNEVLNRYNSKLLLSPTFFVPEMSLKEILHMEHIKNQENSGIFEIENEYVKYLDPVIVPSSQHNEKKKRRESLIKIEKEEEVEKEEKESKHETEIENKEEVVEELKPQSSSHHSSMVEEEIICEPIDIHQENSNEKKKEEENNNDEKINVEEEVEDDDKVFSNFIIHSKNYLSLKHTFDYPYNFYKGISDLQPLRKQLFAKKSKRCLKCKQYILKFHNSNVENPFRLNHCALKYFPRIYINDFKIIKRRNGILNFVLINPLEAEMKIKLITLLDSKFLNNLNVSDISVNCLSVSNTYEFSLSSHDDVLADLSKESCNIVEVIHNDTIIVKKQNNMALVIISFSYNDSLEPSDFPLLRHSRITQTNFDNIPEVVDDKAKLNFPLILECSFPDKSKKIHTVRLNLLFTNHINTRQFYTPSLL